MQALRVLFTDAFQEPGTQDVLNTICWMNAYNHHRRIAVTRSGLPYWFPNFLKDASDNKKVLGIRTIFGTWSSVPRDREWFSPPWHERIKQLSLMCIFGALFTAPINKPGKTQPMGLNPVSISRSSPGREKTRKKTSNFWHQGRNPIKKNQWKPQGKIRNRTTPFFFLQVKNNSQYFFPQTLTICLLGEVRPLYGDPWTKINEGPKFSPG